MRPSSVTSMNVMCPGTPSNALCLGDGGGNVTVHGCARMDRRRVAFPPPTHSTRSAVAACSVSLSTRRMLQLVAGGRAGRRPRRPIAITGSLCARRTYCNTTTTTTVVGCAIAAFARKTTADVSSPFCPFLSSVVGTLAENNRF